jgi:hypothetical protein
VISRFLESVNRQMQTLVSFLEHLIRTPLQPLCHPSLLFPLLWRPASHPFL